MELFCPACQKKLIIEDQYAGQMMKCPMCQATFTAPTLPSFSTSPSSLPGGPPPMPPAQGFAPPPPMPQQQYQGGPPPGYQQPGPPSQPYVPPTRSTEYKKTCAVSFNPVILQWIPVGAVVLIFVLSFFPWVWLGQGFYHKGFGSGKAGYGGAYASQNGWQAAFGSYSLDSSLEKDGDPFKEGKKTLSGDEVKPTVDVLGIFYVLLLVLAFLLVVAAGVLGILHTKLPPNLQFLISFRWALAAGICFLLFFFLTLQMLFGVGMERAINQAASKEYTEAYANADNAMQKRVASLFHTTMLSFNHRTAALDVVWWLNLIAVAFAGLVFWIDVRKTAPIPKLEFKY